MWTARLMGATLAAAGLVACGEAPAGAPDAGPDAPAALDAAPPAWTTTPACAAAQGDIYADAEAAGARGEIVTCALGEALDLPATAAQLAADGLDVAATSGVRVIKLAYRTVRSGGAPAISTATIYLPTAPRALPAPVVLVGRPTAGLADTCAPSRQALPERTLALPLAARGFVMVVPDFAGLGNGGVHAYLDNHEQATQLFDALAAARALLPAGLVGDAVAALGYSQGGGTVLSAQALEHALTGRRTLRAVAALAPQWPISTRSFGYELVLRNPGQLTSLAGLAPPPVTVMRHHGYFVNKVGPSAGGAAFPAAERDSILSSIDRLCTLQLGAALNGAQPRLRDLVDPTFRAQVLACIDGAAGCAGDGAAFHAWLTGDFVSADPAGAPVAVIQGLGDLVMPAASEAACVVAKLRADGVEPVVHADTLATHESVLERRVADASAWLEAHVDGAPPPDLARGALPACAPR